MGTEREEPAKLKLSDFLRGSLDCTDFVWEAGPSKNEPPDYYLTVRGVKYAVEMTSTPTVVAPPRGNPIQIEAYRDAMRKLAEEATKRSIEAGSLRGYYVIHTYRPIHDFRSQRERLLTNILSYVRETTGPNSAKRKAIERRGLGATTVEKIKPEPCLIEHTHSMLAREPTIATTTCELLRTVLKSKTKKLNSGSVSEPRILVVANTYPFAEVPHYEATRELLELSSFAEVFVLLGTHTVRLTAAGPLSVRTTPQAHNATAGSE